MIRHCSICGQVIMIDDKCDVCSAAASEEIICFCIGSSGKIIMWWVDGEDEIMKPDGKVAAKDFAELVRARRKECH